jgi:hypothetical protein
LKRYRYFEEDNDIVAPQGIHILRSIIEQAKEKLASEEGKSIDTAMSQGTLIAEAIESTLQILVLFYGSYLLPTIFQEYIREQANLTESPSKVADWWKSTQSQIPRLITQLDIYNFLIEHRTQMELSLRILNEFESYLLSESILSEQFYSRFGRHSIFPPLDDEKLSRRIRKVYQESFIKQLESIRALRNAINHSVQILRKHSVSHDPLDIFEKAKELSERSSFFFEAGRLHALFPKTILVTSLCQNLNRKWKVTAIDEKENLISFLIDPGEVIIFIPNCEIMCWPQEGRSNTPDIAFVKRSL